MNTTKNVTPEQVAQELDRISTLRDGLRPADVVEESRPQDAVLHESFEWDDQRAAELHRHWQARTIIRCVSIVSEEAAGPQPVYIHVPATADDGPRYMPTEIVVRQPDMLDLALRDMLTRLDSAQKSLDALKRAVESAQRPSLSARRVRQAAKALTQARDCLSI
jgi:hypothetical protein